MNFDWDPEKSEASLADRGFDFEFATLIFDGPILQVEDRRRDYGEVRFVAIGLAEGIALTVVFTDRPDPAGGVVRRVISARRSNRHERKAYETAIQEQP